MPPRVFLTLASSALLALPAFAPVAPAAGAAAVLVRITPAVRDLLSRLRDIDVPAERRRRNWTGRRGEGSCVHASLVMLLHWQGRHELAEWWQARYGDGETPEGLAGRLEAAGIRWAETRTGEVAFLEWALRTRRGAAVVVQRGAHMVVLAGFDEHQAQILDSNFPDRVQAVARDAFLRDWKQSGGWAVTPLGTPGAPPPWVVRPAAARGGDRAAVR